MSRPGPHHGRAASRLRYASELWRQYIAHESLPQFDRWLAAALKQYPQFGRRDRRAYSEILFTAIRFAYLAAFLDVAGRQPAGEAALDSAVKEFSKTCGSPAAAANAIRRLPAELVLQVAGFRYAREVGDEWPLAGLAAGELGHRSERLLEVLERRRADTSSLAMRLLWQGIPLDFAAHLAARAERSGWTAAELDAFLAAQARKPPLWLRLNHLERSDEVLQELEAYGLDVEAHGEALRVTGERGIYELPAYRAGAFEIQDWASQQIGRDVEARPGELVWDACAGGGGKSVQLAAALANKGALYASDIRTYKLSEVRRRTARAGFHNVRTLGWEGGELPAFSREVDSRRGFHWVLVDAPCSSTGTWRRNPDARFRVSAESLQELTALQLRLLEHAAMAVRIGGGLVYSTCSWLVEENEAVVERFLADNPHFRLQRMRLHGCPSVDADTMFSAVLLRVS